MQSQTFVFLMYNNNNTYFVVTYFYVCVIFNVISRSNRGQITEKWAFSEYKYQFSTRVIIKIVIYKALFLLK